MKSHSSGGIIGRIYDRIIALLMAVALMTVWVYLGIQMGTMREQSRRFIEEMDQMKPKYLRAAPMDVTSYEEADKDLAEPLQIPAWTNLLFVPETRVWCVDCRRPIPMLADACPFCKSGQPVQPVQDTDGDGMPDAWEEKYGLNPRDPSDAARDDDGDGASNAVEHRYNTNPKDKSSSPPLGTELFLEKIVPEPFLLLFKSLIRMPDGDYKFGINTRDRTKTHFVKVGETLKEGLKVEKFDLRFVGRVNKSILTLSRSGKMIPLVYGEEVTHSDYTAHLVFAPDKTAYAVKKDGIFEIREKKHKVIDIDSSASVVVIEREIDGVRFSIGKSLEQPQNVEENTE